MLTEVTLKNFQAHEARTFRFSPGLNVITGPSDTGKSVLVRGLDWLARHGNQNYTTHGKTECTVTVTTERGTVTRFRGKKSGYTVNGEEYVAVGTNQPVPVKQVLPLADINFQFQHDGPFLVSLTPGQTAKEINKIVDLSIIDACVSWCKKTLTKENTILKAVEDEIQSLQERHEALSWVPAAQEAWSALEAMRRALAGVETRISEIENMSKTLKEVNTAGKNANFVARAVQNFLSNVPEFPDCSKLDDLIRQHKEASATLSGLEALVSAFSVFPVLISQLRAAVDKHKKLSLSIQEFRESVAVNEIAEAKLKKTESELGACPVCGKSLTKDHSHG